MRSFTAIIERCQDTGLYVGFIPGFQEAHTQAETLDELNELYDLIHYFRLGLLYEQQELNTKKAYPLRGLKIRYEEPFEPVAVNDWEAR